MASSAKNIQLRELKDTILQLNTMVSEQTELIKSLRIMIDEKSRREKVLQEQVDYFTPNFFGSSRERRSDDIPGKQNLFDEAEIEQDTSLLEEETVIREHTRKKKAAHDDLFKGLKVEKVGIPLPKVEQACPVCGTQMVLIGEEYVRRELEFVPATCKVIEYYSQSYGCPSCKEGLGDTEKPVIIKSRLRWPWSGKVQPRHPLLCGRCTRSTPTDSPFTARKRTGNSMTPSPLLIGSSAAHRTISGQCMITSTGNC